MSGLGTLLHYVSPLLELDGWTCGRFSWAEPRLTGGTSVVHDLQDDGRRLPPLHR